MQDAELEFYMVNVWNFSLALICCKFFQGLLGHESVIAQIVFLILIIDPGQFLVGHLGDLTDNLH